MIEQQVTRLGAARGKADQVVVPAELFRFLIRCALERCEFDEAQYQRCNPDVADAVDMGEIASGREHFLDKGYFEDRVGAVPVDEGWYLSRNPDVAEAERAGLAESAEAHYRAIGASEWREPNPGCVGAVRAWKEVLS
jgi:hypothetical protein